MKTFISIICFLNIFLCAHAHERCSQKTTEPLSHEITRIVSNQDLYLDQDDMMVIIDGLPYLVQALQKSGSHWKAQLVSAGYCPMGHLLCGGCLLCHKPGCIYYIKPCKLWN